MSFSYSSVVDRSYKRYACEDYDDIAFLHHPSGVTVVVLREELKSEVVEVNFGSVKRNGVDRGEQVVVGKGKKGGLQLQKETRLCTLKMKDGTEKAIRAGLRGILAEVNDRLKLNPDLIRTAPENQGYIAIVTHGAGKRHPQELINELPSKRVCLRNRDEPKIEAIKSSNIGKSSADNSSEILVS